MSQVTFSINETQVHKGTAYAFANVLRPPPYLNVVNNGYNPPTISDRSLGTWVASKGTWVTATAYPVGTVIVDENGNAEIVTAIVGTGTSGGAEPTWPTIPGQTAVDNTGANQITWQMLGRVGTAHTTGTSGNWVPSFAYVQDDQIRDANGNVQWCIIGGTSYTGAPTWLTTQNGITVESTGVTWMNLGPTVGLGGSEGNFTFDAECKEVEVQPDQVTLPLVSLMTGESGGLGGEFMQLDPKLMVYTMPHAQVTSGLTDLAQPATAQNFTALTMGGLVTIPHYCMAVLSPRPLFIGPGTTRFYTGIIQKAAAAGSKPGTGFTRTKISTWKGEWKAHAIGSWPNGANGVAFFEQ
jgi:hypothetical protein